MIYYIAVGNQRQVKAVRPKVAGVRLYSWIGSSEFAQPRISWDVAVQFGVFSLYPALLLFLSSGIASWVEGHDNQALGCCDICEQGALCASIE